MILGKKLTITTIIIIENNIYKHYLLRFYISLSFDFKIKNAYFVNLMSIKLFYDNI